MTWVDLVVLAVLALSALLAFMRGFVREVLGIGAWVGRASSPASGRCRCVRAAVPGMAAATRPGSIRSPSPSVFLVALIVLMLIIARPDRRRGARLGARRRRPHAGRWSSASPGVRRWSSSPISLQGWWCRSTAGPSRCCTRASLPLCLCRRRVGARASCRRAYRPAAWSSRRRRAGDDARPSDLLQRRRRRAAPIGDRPGDRIAASSATTCRMPPRSSPTTTSCTRNAASSASGTCPTPPRVTALGLHALQHRGQEATGIVTFDGDQFHSHRGLGLVGDNFGDARVIATLPGARAIGHNRYATTGDTVLRNVQPLFADFEFGGFAVAHNGNLTNAHRAAPRAGAPRLPVPVDHRHRGHHPPDRDQPLLHRRRPADRRAEAGEGAYSLVALSNEALIGVRDPLGVRPLILGRIGIGGHRRLGAGLRDLRARHRRRRLRARRRAGRDRRHRRPGRAQHQARSAARASASASSNTSTSPGPTSVDGGHAVYEARKRIGAELARESRRARRRGRAGARFRRARGDRLRRPRAASRSSSASSATTMSAAPSSSRPTTSAISA